MWSYAGYVIVCAGVDTSDLYGYMDLIVVKPIFRATRNCQNEMSTIYLKLSGQFVHSNAELRSVRF